MTPRLALAETLSGGRRIMIGSLTADPQRDRIWSARKSVASGIRLPVTSQATRPWYLRRYRVQPDEQ